ncbi:hypothetical protein PoB_002948000, partial [Plakobranchus ocellatus]
MKPSTFWTSRTGLALEKKGCFSKTGTQLLPRSPAKRNPARNSSRTPGLQQSFTYRTMRRTSTRNGLSSFLRKTTRRSAKR